VINGTTQPIVDAGYCGFYGTRNVSVGPVPPGQTKTATGIYDYKHGTVRTEAQFFYCDAGGKTQYAFLTGELAADQSQYVVTVSPGLISWRYERPNVPTTTAADRPTDYPGEQLPLRP
jgi:hypothetical protein